jgi:hypothetical protein
MTERAIGVVRRIDVAIAADYQSARFDIPVRRSRPIEASDTDKVETAIIVGATTRSRIPDSLIWAKITGEIYAFVPAIVAAVIIR